MVRGIFNLGNGQFASLRNDVYRIGKMPFQNVQGAGVANGTKSFCGLIKTRQRERGNWRIRWHLTLGNESQNFDDELHVEPWRPPQYLPKPSTNDLLQRDFSFARAHRRVHASKAQRDRRRLKRLKTRDRIGRSFVSKLAILRGSG